MSSTSQAAPQYLSETKPPRTIAEFQNFVQSITDAEDLNEAIHPTLTLLTWGANASKSPAKRACRVILASTPATTFRPSGELVLCANETHLHPSSFEKQQLSEVNCLLPIGGELLHVIDLSDSAIKHKLTELKAQREQELQRSLKRAQKLYGAVSLGDADIQFCMQEIWEPKMHLRLEAENSAEYGLLRSFPVAAVCIETLCSSVERRVAAILCCGCLCGSQDVEADCARVLSAMPERISNTLAKRILLLGLLSNPFRTNTDLRIAAYAEQILSVWYACRREN